MTGVSVQVGPRWAGQRCMGWGLAIARDRDLVITAVTAVAVVLASLALAALIVLAVMAATGRFSQPAPAYVPVVFCPAGQHVTGISASGWPDCAPNR